jgi:hypothetical protein
MNNLKGFDTEDAIDRPTEQVESTVKQVDSKAGNEREDGTAGWTRTTGLRFHRPAL